MLQLITAAIVTRLQQAVPTLRYTAADWGQLDYWDMPPVQYPCALVEVQQASYSQLGELEQLGQLTIAVRLAALVPHLGSAQAPPTLQASALDQYQLAEEVHGVLHGWEPLPTAQSSILVRTQGSRMKRQDGIQVWQMLYTCQVVDALPAIERVPRPVLKTTAAVWTEA